MRVMVRSGKCRRHSEAVSEVISEEWKRKEFVVWRLGNGVDCEMNASNEEC